MGKLLIALIVVTVIGIIVATASSYVAPSLFETPPGTDEPGSMDMGAVPSDVMEYPAAVAFVEKHRDSYVEMESLESGMTKLIIVSGYDGSQLTIEQGADGTVTNMEYVCFYPDGLSMEIIEGPDVADQIPPLC